MVASDMIRFMFWMTVFFVIAFTFYGISSVLLPRLIVYNQLPETQMTLHIDNADSLSQRLATGICNLWQARGGFSSGFESITEYRSTSGTVDRGLILDKLSTLECVNIKWDYQGDTISDSKKTYEVTVSFDSGIELITVKVKQK